MNISHVYMIRICTYHIYILYMSYIIFTCNLYVYTCTHVNIIYDIHYTSKIMYDIYNVYI